MLRAATVAQVHTHYIEAGTKGFLRRSQHVNRSAGALDAMPENYRWLVRAIVLPATMRQHANARLYFKQTFFVGFKCAQPEAPRPGITGQGLRVTIGEKWMRLER